MAGGIATRPCSGAHEIEHGTKRISRKRKEKEGGRSQSEAEEGKVWRWRESCG